MSMFRRGLAPNAIRSFLNGFAAALTLGPRRMYVERKFIDQALAEDWQHLGQDIANTVRKLHEPELPQPKPQKIR